MKTNQMTVTANTPDTDEFAKKFPQYGPFARDKGAFLFKVITTVESFNRMQILTELNYPAVTGIAEICYQETSKKNGELSGYTKQFIGAVVCSVMEMNGYSKTGKKKTIPHKYFTKGEVYKNDLAI